MITNRNVWDPVARRSKTKVLCHLGPADELDKGALQRLAHSLSRLLDPEDALVLQARLSQVPDVEYLGGRLLGGPWLLDRLWKRLGIDQTLREMLAKRGYSTPVERLLFAMVANRALAPSSKHAMEFWDFEVEGEDADQVDESGQIESKGLREWGHSKDGRGDLVQVVVAFAVTRDGIPVRCWVFPGSTSDQSIVEKSSKTSTAGSLAE